MQWQWFKRLGAWLLFIPDKLIGYSPNDNAYDVAIAWTKQDERRAKELEQLRKEKGIDALF